MKDFHGNTDEKKIQENCPFCHNFDGHGPEYLPCKTKDAYAALDSDECLIVFDNSDGHSMYGKIKINLCPMCGRKLRS